MKAIYRNLPIALESIKTNKLQSILATLGIVFGVAAVITMLAIGNGAQQKIIEQLKVVGANNIFINANSEENKVAPDKKSEEESPSEAENPTAYSPGLTSSDAQVIQSLLPDIRLISPVTVNKTYASAHTQRHQTQICGVSPAYFNIFQLKTAKGKLFSTIHNKESKNVCVLGAGIAKKLFPKTDPLGQYVKINHLHLLVTGILAKQADISDNLQGMGMNNFNESIFTPVNTINIRYRAGSSQTNAQMYGNIIMESSGKGNTHHQLDKIVIQFNDPSQLSTGAQVIQKCLNRTHNGQKDINIVIPEKLLQQQKETDELFSILLGAIAGISLIVGGIGIMNIMLASVMERIREIGLRQAIGATKTDIKAQFVLEASLISLTGGIFGIILGIIASHIIKASLEMPIMISNFSIILSSMISILTGIIFGYLPAKKASENIPVESLRYE